MHSARRLNLAVALAFTVAVFASACGAGVPEATAGGAHETEPFAQEVSQAVAEAQEADASADQLAQLEDAARDGKVSTEAERQALHRTVACMHDAGYEAEVLEDVTHGSWKWPHLTYAWDSNADAVYDQCSKRESYWIDYVYQTQPSAIETKDRYLRKQLPIVVECLGREGISVPEDEALPVTLDRAMELLQTSGGQVDCLTEAAIDGY